MKFSKALQKTESERTVTDLPRDRDIENGVTTPNGDFLGELLADKELKIGAPDPPRNGTKELAVLHDDVRPVGEDDSVLAPSNKDNLSIDFNALPDFLVDPALVNPHLISITQPNSSPAEEYRSLRTQIIHTGQRRVTQSIVVASVGPGEGKSVTALNLSWLMAQTEGLRALLIDADLRKPSVAKYLGFETETGFSEVLGGEIPFRQSLIRLQPAGLCLLPGGRPRLDVAELMSGPRLGEILQEARGLFDYVIIDAPPLGVFTDAAVLINNADSALLVVRADHTRYKDVERKLEGLPREKMLGVVLNQSDEVLLENSYYEYGYPKNYLS